MAILKKQTFSSITTVLALLLALAGNIAYIVNVNAEGYFQHASVSAASTLAVLALVSLVLVVVLAQLPLKSLAEKIVDLVSGALRIAAPAALIGAAMLLVSGRAQGLAFIYFSNEEVLAEVQTAANLSSASCAIAAIALLAAASIVAIVASFGKMKK